MKRSGDRQPIYPLALPLWTVICLLLLPLPFPAQAHDPALSWQTLDTPHFAVHFHQGTRDFAVRAAQAAEKAYLLLTAALEHQPADKIQIVVSDQNDSANGWASVLPYNQIQVLTSPPDNLSVLNDYDDFLWILMVHELTHIIHMDTISGLPAWINLLLGRTVFPNGAQPTWFTEGLAVYYESRFSSAGRLRSSLFRMYLRTAALAGVFPKIDKVSGAMKAWPQGTAPYLYGAFFVDYLARRFGETALCDLSQHMSGMWVPWTLNIVARQELGFDYITLYQDWSESVRVQARRTLAKLQRQGLTPFHQLTRRGHHQHTPRISPGGEQILYFSGSPQRWPSLRLVDRHGQQDRELLEVNSGAGAVFLPNGQGIVFAQREQTRQFYSFNDLFYFDLESGQTHRLTKGARLRSADLSPDGETLVAVANRSGQTRLVQLALTGTEIRSHQIRDLLQFQDQTQVYTPRFSPDGKQVVFAATNPGGGRRLLLLDRADGSTRKLTSGRFMDLDPVFTADGKSILFSSDRSGIYNLYRLCLSDGALVQLTNVATGAFAPAPTADGTGIAFTTYGKDGYDIAWLDLPLPKHPPTTNRAPRPDPTVYDSGQKFVAQSYRPWSTLLPHAWLPVIGSDLWGTSYGAVITGRDVLGKLDYRLDLAYGPARQQLYLDLGLAVRMFYPTLFAYVGRHVQRSYNQAILNGRSFPVDRERTTLYFDISFPFSVFRHHHNIFFNYDLHFFDRWTALAFDPGDLKPILPDDSRLSWVGAGWSFSNVHRYSHSISSEEGFSATVSMRLSHPATGSGSRLAEARIWLRSYFPVWRKHNHVLALAIQGARALGDPRRKSLYAVGGLPISDPILDVYYGYRYGGVYLRGYPPWSFSGSLFVLGSLEYRFPLLDIESGFLSLPFYFRRLHAALFTDIGGASHDKLSQDLLKVGIGAELRLDVYLGYYLPATLRFGYGQGLSQGASHNVFLTMGWGF